MPTTRRFGVSGMTCGGCERALGRAVSKLPGVQAVEASHTDHQAIVTFDEALVTPEAIVAAIHAAGYTPEDTPPR